jgi:hypothetical protein
MRIHITKKLADWQERDTTLVDFNHYSDALESGGEWLGNSDRT